ncbi:serine/threonine-protein phosphatase 6 regulatory subunit 3 isoform X4 [Dermacentor albipictus]|uniref:serine/threonine-protein phosphatase 6 regulatory subunit 3 isoform X4 n=1 Tax=Dermacentor albipictus TaxID=60249 RepID=UPI0038FCBF55
MWKAAATLVSSELLNSCPSVARAVTMFWKFNLITTSHVETLLSKENVTLRELMDEEDILQECKAQTKRLVEFLVRPEVMEELVDLITHEPPEDVDEKMRYRYANIACEILTSDVQQINDTLVRSETLMARLLGFLDNEAPLNPLLASFFTKVASMLISRKADSMFYVCMQKENFVSLLLKHIETSAIMDLLLKFVACTDSEALRVSITQWLDKEKLVQQLVALIDPGCSEEKQSNAAEALCEMIKLSREQMSLLQEKAPADPLLESLESTESVAALLEHMFSGDEMSESVFVNGISVLLSLLEFRKQGLAGQQQQQQQQNGNNADGPNGGGLGGGSGPGMMQSETAVFTSLFFRENAEQMTALDVERLRVGVEKVLAAVLPRLSDFLKLLMDPPQKLCWTTTFGVLDPPLGQTRLEVCHLVNALINSNNEDVNKKLAELGALPTILDLFFEYSWNNFLHTQVAQLVSSVISSAHSLDQEGNKVHPLLDQLLGSCTLVQRCLDAWDANTVEQSQPGKHRRGYMGHLTKIVNDIVAAADGGNNAEIVRERLKDLPEDMQGRWKTFTTETLAEINKKNTVILGGGMPNVSSTDDDECIDLRDVGFHQEAALQQAFSDYQMEQVTSNFVEQFGFNDDEFVEADENLVGQLDQLARANFQLPPEVNMQSQAELFERICREKVQTLDDADSDDDIWDDKEVVLSPDTRGRRLVLKWKHPLHSLMRLTDDSEEPYSSDSDDENGPRPSAAATTSEEVKMDVDQAAELDATVAMDTTSPWENAATSNVDSGWATFDNFANFEAAAAAADTTTPAMPVAMETSEQVPSPPTVEAPAVPLPQPSNEPDSTKCPEAASMLAPAIGSHCEPSATEQKPTVESTVGDVPKVECSDSSAPKASTSSSGVNCVELNSAEVSSSADTSIQGNRLPEPVDGPADSTPASVDVSATCKPVSTSTCANGPLPSVEPPKTTSATQISTQRLEDASKANGSGASADEVTATTTAAQPTPGTADGTDPSAPTTTMMPSPTPSTVQPQAPTQPQVQNGPL